MPGETGRWFLCPAGLHGLPEALRLPERGSLPRNPFEKARRDDGPARHHSLHRKFRQTILLENRHTPPDIRERGHYYTLFYLYHFYFSR